MPETTSDPEKIGGSNEPHAETSEHHGHAGVFALALGSVGVVFGDIGTSPLYAFREAMHAVSHGGPPSSANIIGILSLILWSMIVVVTIKYVLILLRADNKGEGGTLSLMALASRTLGRQSPWLVGLGVLGASMFYGDSLITPAISVLSAVEGMKLVAPQLERAVVPITIVILVLLFAVQSRGTAKVATFFGPVMVVWFLALAVAGLSHIADDPRVLYAVNPLYAFDFFIENKMVAFVTMGAVFLVVTGGEALYADLGHFGRKPIQYAWLYFVMPCLVLNYFGQGALVLADPAAVENPFYRLVPGWALAPMILLATCATVIASQAVITGAYSLTRQAMQLGLLPRMEVRYTSESHSGQIFLPRVNTFLLIGVILLVMMFRSSSGLAGAYGIAVTTTMVVDAILAFVVIHRLWGWSIAATAALVLPFLFVDGVFLVANLMKLFDGAWLPLVFAGALIVVMWTWRRGTRILFDKTRKIEVPFDTLVNSLEKRPPHRVAGTAVFLTSDPQSAPAALMHNLKHNKVLHEKNVILTVKTAETPTVDEEERVRMEASSANFSRVTLTFGFMETPNVPKALAICRKLGWKFDIMATSFFLSRRSVRPAAHSGMPLWQDKLFILLARNANDATDYFYIPTGRAVEVGTQVTV